MDKVSVGNVKKNVGNLKIEGGTDLVVLVVPIVAAAMLVIVIVVVIVIVARRRQRYQVKVLGGDEYASKANVRYVKPDGMHSLLSIISVRNICL